MKGEKIFGILVVAAFLGLAFVPIGQVKADYSGGHIVWNYRVVKQYYNGNPVDYIPLVHNSIGEARAYVFRGINGAEGYVAAFVELIRYNSDWRMDSSGYTQAIITYHGESVVYYNNYGVFSPYPRNGGTGYHNYPYDQYTRIGHTTGAYIDVTDAMKYDNWFMNTGHDGNMYWIYHKYQGGEESYWDHAAIGGVFWFGDSHNTIAFNLIKWKVVKGWWIWETHKNMLPNGEAVLKYLRTWPPDY